MAVLEWSLGVLSHGFVVSVLAVSGGNLDDTASGAAT